MARSRVTTAGRIARRNIRSILRPNFLSLSFRAACAGPAGPEPGPKLAVSEARAADEVLVVGGAAPIAARATRINAAIASSRAAASAVVVRATRERLPDPWRRRHR